MLRFSRFALLTTLFVSATAGSWSLAQEAAEGPLARLQGTWKFTSPDGNTGTWTFTAQEVAVKMADGSSYKAVVTLDPKAQPHPSADFEMLEGQPEVQGKTLLGIMKREGKKAIFCVGGPDAPRPSDFAHQPDDIFLFELVKDGPPAEKADIPPALRKFQGTWTAQIGEDRKADFVVKGDKMIVETPNRRYEVTLLVQPESDPQAIDFRVDEGPEDAKGQTNQGIFKLENGVLSVCVSGEPDARPAEFKTEEGKSYVFELTRVRKEKKKDQ